MVRKYRLISKLIIRITNADTLKHNFNVWLIDSGFFTAFFMNYPVMWRRHLNWSIHKFRSIGKHWELLGYVKHPIPILYPPISTLKVFPKTAKAEIHYKIVFSTTWLSFGLLQHLSTILRDFSGLIALLKQKTVWKLLLQQKTSFIYPQ